MYKRISLQTLILVALFGKADNNLNKKGKINFKNLLCQCEELQARVRFFQSFF